MRILYVENHPTFAAIVVNEFLAAHDVTIVPTVAGAIKLFDAERFDAVISDFDLDDGKGIDVVRAVRARDARVPIIGASSHDDGNAALIAAGADAVCSKMQFAEIAAVIERLVTGA